MSFFVAVIILLMVIGMAAFIVPSAFTFQLPILGQFTYIHALCLIGFVVSIKIVSAVISSHASDVSSRKAENDYKQKDDSITSDQNIEEQFLGD